MWGAGLPDWHAECRRPGLSGGPAGSRSRGHWGAWAGVGVRPRPGCRGVEDRRGLRQAVQRRPETLDCGVTLCSYKEHLNVQHVTFYFLT